MRKGLKLTIISIMGEKGSLLTVPVVFVVNFF